METQMKFFRLQNQRSKRYMDVWRSNGNVLEADAHDGDTQRWLIAPVPGDPRYCHLVAKHSGKFLDIWESNGNALEADAHPGDSVRWMLVPDSGNWFRLKNKRSGKFLDVWASTGNVLEWESHSEPQQRWGFIPEEIRTRELAALGQLPQVWPRLEGPFRPPERSKTYVVNRKFLPFFAVDDRGRDNLWKITNSPYYILETRQRYITKPEWFMSNELSNEVELEFSNTSGWSETQSEEFSRTTSMTVSASASYGPFEASVEATEETSFARGSESQQAGERTRTVRTPVAPHKTVAGWAIESEHVLMRTDGSTVNAWKVHGSNHFDEFPDEVAAGIPKRLVPFLETLEKALVETSEGKLDPERAKALAQLARAATGIVEARVLD